MALPISKEFKVGFVIVLAISMMYWGLNYLKGNDVFASNTYYYAVYENTEGLTKAKSVQINGYQVGLIDDIYFHPDRSGRLIVRLKMQLEYPLPKDSKALIHSSGLLGDRNIQLLIGTNSELAVYGDTLGAEVEGSLTEAVNAQVAPIKAKAEKLLGSLDTAVTLLTGFLNEDTKRNFKQSFESLNNTFESLDRSTAILEKFLAQNSGNFDKVAQNLASISANLASNNQNITTVLSNFSAISDSLKKVNIAETFAKANHAIGELETILVKANNGEGSVGALLNNPQLYNNLEDATSSLNRLLLDIKYNPNKYLQFSVFGTQKYYTDDEIIEIEKELKERKKQNDAEERDIDKNID